MTRTTWWARSDAPPRPSEVCQGCGGWAPYVQRPLPGRNAVPDAERLLVPRCVACGWLVREACPALGGKAWFPEPTTPTTLPAPPSVSGSFSRPPSGVPTGLSALPYREGTRPPAVPAATRGPHPSVGAWILMGLLLGIYVILVTWVAQ